MWLQLFFYNIFIRFYAFVARVLGLFNAKALQWVQGRKNIFNHIQQQLSNNNKPTIWLHCSSLGEFEQGIPLLESLKKQFPNYTLVVTFFSPSGYNAGSKTNYAHHYFYLPIDTATNATTFLQIVKPKLIVFVKYDFWYYYLHVAKKLDIPNILVSANFRKNQAFFAWYGKLHKAMLQCFTHLFVQTETSKKLLHTIAINNVSVVGDTRFDRVLTIAQQNFSHQILQQFAAQKPTIVAGSTWHSDDVLLAQLAAQNPQINFIIAPHNIDEASIKTCTNTYQTASLLSMCTAEVKSQIIIVNSIGLLKHLYQLATIAYVGGGFTKDGVHNVLEASVYGKPVVFGSTYQKYNEAVELLQQQGGFSITNATNLQLIVTQLLNNKQAYNQVAINAKNYTNSKMGATNKIVNYITENRLLTN